MTYINIPQIKFYKILIISESRLYECSKYMPWVSNIKNLLINSTSNTLITNFSNYSQGTIPALDSLISNYFQLSMEYSALKAILPTILQSMFKNTSIISNEIFATEPTPFFFSLFELPNKIPIFSSVELAYQFLTSISLFNLNKNPQHNIYLEYINNNEIYHLPENLILEPMSLEETLKLSRTNTLIVNPQAFLFSN